MGIHVELGVRFQDHLVHLSLVWVFGLDLRLRHRVCASTTTKRTSHRGPHRCGSLQALSFSVSLSLLPPGLVGIADRLTAVTHGFVAFSDQSAGWENRALSLERDFIDAVGRAALGYLAPFPRMTLGRSVLRSGGCTGKWFERKLRMRGDSKLNPRYFTPYRTKPANTFRQGLVAGNCKLQGIV